MTAAPAIVIVDPDGEELHRAQFSDEAGLKTAMEAALKKYGPKEISWTDRPSGKKGVVLVFVDDKKDSEELLKNLTDRTLVKLHDKFEFVKVAYAKDSEDVKKWNVLQAPTIVIHDGKTSLERLTGKKPPKDVKSALQKALKKLDDK